MNPSGGSNRSTSGNAVREQSITFDALNTGPITGNLETDPESTRAIIDAEERKAHQQQLAHQEIQNHKRLVKFAIIGILLLIGLGVVVLRHNVSNKTLNSGNADASERFPITSVPLGNLNTNSSALSVENSKTLSINGQLNVNNSLVLSPTTQPNGAITGQLYYNQANNQLEYYNGSSFQSLITGSDVVNTSLGGASGKIATGNGVSVSGNTLNNTGVLSVGGHSGNVALGNGLSTAGGALSNSGVLTLQGESGNVTLAAGPGIVVSGTTLSNSGLLSLGGQNGNIAIGGGLAVDNGTLRNTGIISATGAGMITVTNDGNGNITIDGPNGGVGSGTIASPGGTTNHLAKFTGVQTIADSLITDDGTTVTIGGALDVTGGVTLSSPLAITNGGTSATTAAGARVNLGAAVSGANNDITSLTGLTTALSVSQGGTGVGVLPTNDVLVGNGTSAVTGVTSASAGLCLISTVGTPIFQTCPGSGGVASINALTGALTIAGTSGGSVNSTGSTITLNDATSAVKGLASFNSTDLKVTNGNVDTVQSIAVTATPTFGQLTLTSSQAAADMLDINNTNTGATGNLLNLELNGASKLSVSPIGNLVLAGSVNGQTIGSSTNFTGNVAVGSTLSVNTISPTSALTVGVGGQAFTLQGNASSVISATNGTGTTTVGFQSPTANVTYNFATAVAGTYTICTTAGNCVGQGGGVTSPGGTTNTLAMFTGSNSVGNSILTESGSTITVGGTLSASTITPTSALTVGSNSENMTLQGATVSLSDTSGAFKNTLVFVSPSGSNKTITVPNATGTVAVSASGPLSLDANGNLTCPTCLTSGGSGGTSGVSSVNALSGALTLQGTDANSITSNGTTITINNATSSDLGLASFNATDLKVTNGNVDTVQSIAVTATPTFAGLNLSAALSVANGGTGATTAAGARSNLGAAASGANNDITSLSGLTTALSVLQGGTGVNTLTANGVLVGNGTSPVTSVTGSNGQCLMIVSGTPAFGACPGGGSSPVTSLDGLTGALTINNSSGSGSNITISNAAADGVTKGIAAFNGTNFSASNGVIDTIQDIDTGATPTFNGLGLSNALTVLNGGTGATTAAGARSNLGAAASGTNSDITKLTGLTTALSVSQGGTGLSALTANELLFASGTGSVSQLANGSSGECLVSNGSGSAPNFQACPGSGGVTSVNGFSGAITIANATGSLGTITINNAAADGSTKGIAAFNSTNFSASNGIVNTIQGIATTSTPTFAGLNLSTALTVANGGTGLATLTADGILYASSSSAISQLAVGSAGQCLISNGAGSAASWQTCPGSGGGGYITGGGTSGLLALFNGSGSITNSDITDTSGTNVSVASGVSLSIQGAATFEDSTNSSTAFQVKDKLGNSILNVDTSNDIVGTAAVSTASTNSQNFTLQSGNATGTSSTAGNVSIDVGTSTTGSGSINIGNANASTINISDNAETSSAISPVVYIQSPSNANASSVYTTYIGDLSKGKSVVTIGATGSALSTSAVVLQSTNTTETISGGTVSIKNTSNSSGAFSIQGSSTTTVFNVSASSGQVTVNSTGTPLVLNMDNSGEEDGIDFETGGSFTGEIGIAGANGQIITQANSGDLAIKSYSGNILFAAGGTNAEMTIDTNGDTTFQNTTDSATLNAFQVKNHGGINLISVDTGAATPTVNIGVTGTDTLAGAVNIGTSTGTTQQVTVGSSVSASITNIQAGSGGITMNDSTGSSIGIGNTLNDIINIGNSGNDYAITLQGNGISQTVTGSTSNPTDIIKTTTNSTTAFQIQNNSGYNVFNISTSAGSVTLGNRTSTVGQGVAGSLAFADGSNDNELLTLDTAPLSGNFTLNLPGSGASAGQCLVSASGSSNSNTTLAFGSCSASATTLQQAYNASAGASPDIDMTSANKGFTIQNDNTSPITGNLFSVNTNASSGLGASLFSVANTGATTIASGSATAFQIQNSVGTSFLTANSAQKIITTSDLEVGNSSTNVSGSGRLFSDDFESGDFGLWTDGVTQNTSTIAVSSAADRDGKYSAHYVGSATAGAKAYVQNTFTDSNTPTALTVRLYMDIVALPTSGNTLNFIRMQQGGNTTNAFHADLNSSGQVEFQYYNGATTSTCGVTATSLTTGSWHELEFRIGIGNPAAASVWLDDISQTMSGGDANCTNISSINTSSATSWNQIRMGDASNDAGQYYIDDLTVDDTTGVGDSASLNVSDSMHVSGSATFGGDALFQSSVNTTNAFEIQNANGNAMLTADTNDGYITIGSGTAGESTPVLLVLDSDTSSTAPASVVSGAMYYDSVHQSFKCGVDGTWVGCLGGLAYTNTDQSSLPGGDTISGAGLTSGSQFTDDYTIPANMCTQGRVFEVNVLGTMTVSTGSETFRPEFFLGSTSIAHGVTGGSLSVPTGTFTWQATLYITCSQNPSATALITANGIWTIAAQQPNGTSTYNQALTNQSATVDTTSTQALAMDMKGVSGQTASITLQQMIVQALGP